jgi:chromosome partitioning protein
MKNIVISSQKGGSAKSTLATLLSVEAERAGDGPAWIVDTDQQGTLTRWHERREAETPLLAQLSVASLRAGLISLAEKRRPSFCFIDTAPAISGQSASIIELADLVIIPVQPSPGDLWAVADTIEIVKAAGKAFRFVITKAKPQANITAEAVAALSNHGPVAAAFIADRVAYAAALGSGQTAPELQPKGSAAAETTKLWQEIKSCFNENRKSLKKAAHG